MFRTKREAVYGIMNGDDPNSWMVLVYTYRCTLFKAPIVSVMFTGLNNKEASIECEKLNKVFRKKEQSWQSLKNFFQSIIKRISTSS